MLKTYKCPFSDFLSESVFITASSLALAVPFLSPPPPTSCAASMNVRRGSIKDRGQLGKEEGVLEARLRQDSADEEVWPAYEGKGGWFHLTPAYGLLPLTPSCP